MNHYEAVLLIRKDVTLENIDLLFEEIEKIAIANKVKITLREYWGLRQLAYKINKSSRGHYIFFKINANIEVIKEIEKFARYNEDIVRCKFFNSDDKTENSRLFISEKAVDALKAKKRQDTELDMAINAMNIES